MKRVITTMILSLIISYALADDMIVDSTTVVDTLPNMDVNQVVVKGRVFTRDLIPVQVMTGKKMESLNAQSVADAIRYFSGAQIKDYGGIGGLKTVNIRSMGSQHVGVFYDGIEIGNAQNGVVDLGRFSMDNMQAIYLYNGQKSAIFQSAKDYASASSVYMETKKPNFMDDKPYNINISLRGGSFETINPSILVENKITEKLSSSFNAEYMYTSGKYKFKYAKKDGYDTTEVRKNGDVRMFRLDGGLFGKIKDGQWKAKIYWYNSERGYPGASVREEPGKFRHQDRQWDDNVFLQGQLTKRFTPYYRFRISGKYSWDYLHYKSDPRLDVTTMYVDNTYRQRESYLSVVNMFSIKNWWDASLSIDGQRNTLSADLTDFVYPTRNTLLSSLATSMTFEKIKMQASLLSTYVHDKTKVVSANAGDKFKLTPAFFVSYTPIRGSELTFRAFYKQIFRLPTLNDLYYTFIGNKNLNPEFTKQYDFGVLWGKDFNGFFKRFELTADGYFNQVQDKIIAMPTSNQFRWTMLNLGYVEIKGIDVTLGCEFWKFDVRLNYTYQKAQDFTDPGSLWYGGQIPYIPWHSGGAIVGMEIGSGWYINYSFIYTGERYESIANIEENYAQPWYTHDIAITKNFSNQNSWVKGLKLTLEVNNILNQQYEVVQCYPMPGINFRFKVGYTF